MASVVLGGILGLHSFTYIVPAELQHGPHQGELLVDLLALQVGEDLLEAVADTVHGHVPAEYDAEGKHVEEDPSLHGQLLVARRSLLLGHTVLEGGVVKVHLVHLCRHEAEREMREKL